MRRAMRLRAMVSFAGEDDGEISPPLDALGAWFRADNAGSIDGGTVSAWPDRSANANNLTLTGGATAGIFRASPAGFGGKPAIEFAGLTQFDRMLPVGFATGQKEFSSYIVVEHEFAGSLEVVWGYGAVPAASGAIYVQQVYVSPNRWIWSSLTGQFETSTGANGDPKILSFSIADGALHSSADVRANGVVVVPIVASGGYSMNATIDALFVGGYGGATFAGKVAEIIYYSKQHNSAERSETLAYLSARYGIGVA